MVRLRRSSPDRRGGPVDERAKGFVYLDEDGKRLSAEDAQRVKDLVIPPAWEDVWVCPWPNGHLQAVGTDDAGRRQYLYHPDWRTRRDGEKFQKMLTFGKALSRAREQVLVDLGAEGMTQASARARSPYGCSTSGTSGSATTSTPRRTTASGSPRSNAGTSGARARLVFDFVGKSGIEHMITIDDPGAVEALEVMRKRRGGDDRLLAWKDGAAGGRWTRRSSTSTSAGRRAWRPRPRTSAPGTRPSSRRPRWRPRVSRRPAARKRAVVGGDEGGLGVPRQHAHVGAVGVRRPARGGRVRGGQDDRVGDAADVQDGGRAAGGARARGAAPAEE